MIGQGYISKSQHHAFHLWQEGFDNAIRSWMTSPFVLGFNSFWFRQSLDLYQVWLENAQKMGFNSASLHNYFKSTLNIFSVGTQQFMANVRFAQKGGILPETAKTDAETILLTDDFRLLRYQSKKRKYTTPILIVSSLVGKYYILDLTPERSYVSHLLEEGFDVFIIDWTTTEKSAKKGLNEYIGDYLTQIVDKICEVSSSGNVSLLGYSMGGILAVIYSALNPEKVKNLILLTTPIDFSHQNTIGEWTSEKYFDVDRLTDLFGNISGEMVSLSMQMVKPVSSVLRGINALQYADNKEDFDALLALEIWLRDATPLPAKLFKEIIKKLYRQNLLARNELKIAGKKVELSKIKASVLNIIGTHDQVATPENSQKLMDLLGDIDKEQLLLEYGHLTISVGSGAKEDFWQMSAKWLKEKSKI